MAGPELIREQTKLKLAQIYLGILNHLEPAGIANLHVISPQDLALVGATVYAPDQAHHQFDSTDHAEAMFTQLSPQLRRSYGLSQAEFVSRYRPLIGLTNLLEGELVPGIIAWAAKLPAPEQEKLERSFAVLFALCCGLEPSFIPRTLPGVLIDYHHQEIAFTGSFRKRLPFIPNIVMEYGPGLAAIHKFPAQIHPQQQWIFVENNRFVNQVIMTTSGLHGLYPPQIIGREDGISGTTGELLGLGMTNRVGLIIASGIQEAGIEEITAGISQGSQLLQPKGFMAIRAAHPIAENQPTAETMIQLAQAAFGTQALVDRQFTAPHPLSGEPVTITDAIFQKR